MLRASLPDQRLWNKPISSLSQCFGILWECFNMTFFFFFSKAPHKIRVTSEAAKIYKKGKSLKMHFRSKVSQQNIFYLNRRHFIISFIVASFAFQSFLPFWFSLVSKAWQLNAFFSNVLHRWFGFMTKEYTFLKNFETFNSQINVISCILYRIVCFVPRSH